MVNSIPAVGIIAYKSLDYADGSRQVEIRFNKDRWRGLPAGDGQRVKFVLIMSGRAYTVGIRAINNFREVWICPDVIDSSGQKMSLSEALSKSGFKIGDEVCFREVRPMKKYHLQLAKRNTGGIKGPNVLS